VKLENYKSLNVEYRELLERKLAQARSDLIHHEQQAKFNRELVVMLERLIKKQQLELK
jgi:hypothetical protein